MDGRNVSVSMATVRNGGSECGIPASTARKSKRRFRVDSGEKRSRQREFASAGEAGATDTVTQERCRVSIGEPEGTISRPEGRSGRYSQGGTTREQRCSESAMIGDANG